MKSLFSLMHMHSTHMHGHASSQAHIIEILECMGCEEYDSSVRRLPHVDVRQRVIYASNEEIDAADTHRVQNVFWRGIKAWARILLPNFALKADTDLKIVVSIKSVVGAETTEPEPIDDDQVPSVAAPQLDKRGRPASDGGKKKSRINFDELDVSKDLLKWTKSELEAYLIHHHIKSLAISLSLSGVFRNIWQTLCNDYVDCYSHIHQHYVHIAQAHDQYLERDRK